MPLHMLSFIALPKAALKLTDPILGTRSAGFGTSHTKCKQVVSRHTFFSCTLRHIVSSFYESQVCGRSVARTKSAVACNSPFTTVVAGYGSSPPLGAGRLRVVIAHVGLFSCTSDHWCWDGRDRRKGLARQSVETVKRECGIGGTYSPDISHEAGVVPPSLRERLGSQPMGIDLMIRQSPWRREQSRLSIFSISIFRTMIPAPDSLDPARTEPHW
jgi:hypothetical protein